jgi:hypothetical protein
MKYIILYIININLKKNKQVKLIAFDEQLIGYQPSAMVKKKAETMGCPIPVVYIPHKPHLNRLLVYHVCKFCLIIKLI